jgi:hypothetical protein
MTPFTFYIQPLALHHGTNAPVIAVKTGEVGYWPIYTRAHPDALNHGALPLEVEEAALAGSIVGWGAPAAAPALAYAAAHTPATTPATTQGE